MLLTALTLIAGLAIFTMGQVGAKKYALHHATRKEPIINHAAQRSVSIPQM